MSIAMAVVESVAQSMIYGILYIVSFTLLLWGLKILIRATDLVLKLPGLHLANSLGGGAIGLIEAGLLVFLVIWVARRLGVSFETDAVAATHLLRFPDQHAAERVVVPAIRGGKADRLTSRRED